jgi:hypothetical protein
MIPRTILITTTDFDSNTRRSSGAATRAEPKPVTLLVKAATNTAKHPSTNSSADKLAPFMAYGQRTTATSYSGAV